MENVRSVCGNAVECLGKRNLKDKNFKVVKFGKNGSWGRVLDGINGQLGKKLRSIFQLLISLEVKFCGYKRGGKG